MQIPFPLASHDRRLIALGALAGLLIVPVLGGPIIRGHWEVIGTAHAAKAGHGSGGKRGAEKAQDEGGGCTDCSDEEGGGHEGGKGGSGSHGHSGNRGNSSHSAGMDKILHGSGGTEQH